MRVWLLCCAAAAAAATPRRTRRTTWQHRRLLAAETVSRVGSVQDNTDAFECAALTHETGCYDAAAAPGVTIPADLQASPFSQQIMAAIGVGLESCARCGYAPEVAPATAFDCIKCGEGSTLVVVYGDCSGVCVADEDLTRVTALGFGTLKDSSCAFPRQCFLEDDALFQNAALGTNDLFLPVDEPGSSDDCAPFSNVYCNSNLLEMSDCVDAECDFCDDYEVWSLDSAELPCVEGRGVGFKCDATGELVVTDCAAGVNTVTSTGYGLEGFCFQNDDCDDYAAPEVIPTTQYSYSYGSKGGGDDSPDYPEDYEPQQYRGLDAYEAVAPYAEECLDVTGKEHYVCENGEVMWLQGCDETCGACKFNSTVADVPVVQDLLTCDGSATNYKFACDSDDVLWATACDDASSRFAETEQPGFFCTCGFAELLLDYSYSYGDLIYPQDLDDCTDLEQYVCADGQVVRGSHCSACDVGTCNDTSAVRGTPVVSSILSCESSNIYGVAYACDDSGGLVATVCDTGRMFTQKDNSRLGCNCLDAPPDSRESASSGEHSAVPTPRPVPQPAEGPAPVTYESTFAVRGVAKPVQEHHAVFVSAVAALADVPVEDVAVVLTTPDSRRRRLLASQDVTTVSYTITSATNDAAQAVDQNVAALDAPAIVTALQDAAAALHDAAAFADVVVVSIRGKLVSPTPAPTAAPVAAPSSNGKSSSSKKDDAGKDDANNAATATVGVLLGGIVLAFAGNWLYKKWERRNHPSLDAHQYEFVELSRKENSFQEPFKDSSYHDDEPFCDEDRSIRHGRGDFL